jgi:predicted NBD/HSP70 family sugar kinase
MSAKFAVRPHRRPELDPDFVPAVLWNQAFDDAVRAAGGGEPLILALERPNGNVSVHATRIFQHRGAARDINRKYLDRLLKFLLWMKGGCRVTIGGDPALAAEISASYASDGARAFDGQIMGEKIFGHPFTVAQCPTAEAPTEQETQVHLGGHLDGCRIGFDLGGSDRKCAAVRDGEVVFTEEVRWDPYFQKDPAYHRAGIEDSLRRAAAHLPRVDAIGGSAAGVYVDNQVRVASLFRGVSEENFRNQVMGMFLEIGRAWDVPLVVVNDGEVTALAGAAAMNDNAVLGISMGTSLAAGYVNPDGAITDWLNELAFAPVDYRDNAPVDEWSGDRGCGVQYFSQQGVARLAPMAGFDFPVGMPFPEQLVEVQDAMAKGDERAARIYRTIGVCFGYTVAQYATFYELRNLLILGRVTSGTGGEIILAEAGNILREEFPELAGKIQFRTPDESGKRHGQAVAAAGLPERR